MTVRSGNIFYAYNNDGNEDQVAGTTNASTAYVVEWRHEGGNVYQRVNCEEASPAALVTSPTRMSVVRRVARRRAMPPRVNVSTADEPVRPDLRRLIIDRGCLSGLLGS